MDWGLALLGGGLAALWLVVRAVFRWIEVREHLRLWGPGHYGVADGPPADRILGYARIPK